MIKSFPLLAILCIATISNAQFTKVQSQAPVIDGQDSHGAAWVDYDDDGDEDLFVTTGYSSGGSTKDILYRNNGDGTFTKITSSAIVLDDGSGRNSTWGDYDNDGLIDVFITNQLETFLYKNSGGGDFTKIMVIPTTPFSFDSDHSGGAWGDFNNDGFLDLFVASYKLTDNSQNLLYTNNGDGTFGQASASNIVSTPGSSMDPSWIDYDQNGTLDIFVPNYSSTPNFLYSNIGNGTFQAITNQNINTISFASTGASWADYDNDGDFDVVVLANVNANNYLFENNGDGTFEFKSDKFLSTRSSSSSWADFDNDGNIDIMFTGGDGDKTYLFKNNGDKTFTDVSVAQGITNLNYSWAVSSADYDKDGFIDFFIANEAGNGRSVDDILYHNTPNANHWVNIKLAGINSNRSAIGAVLRVKTGTKWQARTIQSKTGNNSQNSLRAHFGLGQATTIDKILIEWPGKGFQEVTNQAVDQFITITEINFPIAPSQAQATNKEFGKIEIKWNDNSSNETGFRIERASGNSSFTTLAEVAANVTSFKDNNAIADITYKYRVTALIAGGYSVFSNVNTIYSRKNQQVTNFQQIGEKFLVSDPFQLHATVSSGISPSFVILDGEEFVSLNGNVLDITALGTSVIGAYAMENDNFFASDTVSQTLTVELITEVEDGLKELSVYPNPADDYVFINRENLRYPIKIINAAGKVVKSVTELHTDEPLSLHGLPAGLYIVMVLDQRIKLFKR
jgi:hypothetical protein